MSRGIGRYSYRASQGPILNVRYLVRSIGGKAIERNSALRATTGGWVGAIQQVWGRSGFRGGILITYQHKYGYKTGC
jgi:hypothetical protein